LSELAESGARNSFRVETEIDSEIFAREKISGAVRDHGGTAAND
jgi:hypothetical protein